MEKLNIQEDPNVTVTNTQLLEMVSAVDNLRNVKVKFERVMDPDEVRAEFGNFYQNEKRL